MRKLTYFVAVAEERHLGRAAERLFMSQPPLTRHIRALEAELDIQLFNRTPRGMELTQAGESLLKDARSIFGLMETSARRAQRAGNGQAGQLDIGLYGSATFGVVPLLLDRFRASHPGVDLGLLYAQTPAQIPALRQGRVLVVFERLLPDEPDIQVELVTSERLLAAMSERHSFAAQRTVDIRALKGQELRVGSSPSAIAVALEMCRRHGFEPRLAPQASDMVMATLQAVVDGGVALVPESMTNVRFPGVCYRPLRPQGDAYMDLHCYWMRHERSPLLAEMLETVRAFRSSQSGTATR